MNKFPLALLAVIGILLFLVVSERGSVLRYKEEQAKVTAALTERVQELVVANAIVVQKNTSSLIVLRNKHENIVNDLRDEYSSRVRDLEKRASRYRSMSEAGAAQCGNLADITARFDRSLEEGRQLVVEFRSRLELREEQLRIIGNQLKADRHLLGQVY